MYIQTSKMKLESVTGNPGWSRTRRELVCCEAWWLRSNDHECLPHPTNYFAKFQIPLIRATYYCSGGARSKAFATLRNVSKLLFWDNIGHAKSVGFRFYSAIWRRGTEWVRNHSDFFDLFFNSFEEERIIILAFLAFEPTHMCDPSLQTRL